MTNPSKTERIVMQRIHRIRLLRFFINWDVLAGILLLLALWSIGREVWVQKVFSNGPQDTPGHALYLVSAFIHTRFVVQALVVITVVSAVFLVREAARLMTRRFTFAPA